MRRQTLATGPDDPRGRDALDQAFNEWEIQTEKMAHVIGVACRFLDQGHVGGGPCRRRTMSAAEKEDWRWNKGASAD